MKIQPPMGLLCFEHRPMNRAIPEAKQKTMLGKLIELEKLQEFTPIRFSKPQKNVFHAVLLNINF